MFQRMSVQVLHGKEGSPGFLANVVNRTDVGMVEGAGGTSLALESDNSSRVRGKIRGQELQRDHASETDIPRLIDNAHPSSAQFFYYAVVGDGLSCDDNATIV